MMWMGKVSAWGAVVFGVAMFGLASLAMGAGALPTLVPTAGGLALLVGAFRTLRKMSGGLRLLCGAWGFAAAWTMAPFAERVPMIQMDCQYTVAPEIGSWLGILMIAAPVLALIGLALTVLHKESK